MPKSLNVALFVTCLVDFFRPSVGFASVKLLEAAGCKVHVPITQTCCGQPAYNGGDRKDAIAIAQQVLDAFEDYEYVVVPSGSCAGMIRKHYPTLFSGDIKLTTRAEALSARTYELVTFLHDICGMRSVKAEYDGVVTYHDSCSSLRELGIREQPRSLLTSVDGLKLIELDDAEVCCGFGGAFSVKYSDISIEIVGRKVKSVSETGADTVIGGDLGCLINIAGRLKREGIVMRVRHVAELLADMTDDLPIGGGR